MDKKYSSPFNRILVLSAVACTVSLWAAANGEEVGDVFDAKAPDGTTYLIVKRYLNFATPPIPGDPAYDGWQVKTCWGTCVGYRVLFDADFSQQEQEDINRLIETDPSGPPYQYRISAPSARYNCYAYMVGRTDVWLYDPEPFVMQCYDAAQLYPFEPDIAGHGRKRVWNFDYQHGSRCEIESYFVWLVGKWGGAGVYKTPENYPADMYGYSDTEFYDRCP
ncbi:MAG: hypothetical protein HY706_07005 [Candidatus Hydrogenedentes bacterium]|nr:hypothetical protein [Candidatus Hydrogenedentota bacterium]